MKARISFGEAKGSVPNYQSTTMIFVTPDRDPAMLRLAYKKLEHSEALRSYFPRFKQHMHRQLTVMSGSLTLQAPFYIMDGIRKELTKGAPVWKVVG
jgi:hypothetical protein